MSFSRVETAALLSPGQDLKIGNLPVSHLVRSQIVSNIVVPVAATIEWIPLLPSAGQTPSFTY